MPSAMPERCLRRCLIPVCVIAVPSEERAAARQGPGPLGPVPPPQGLQAQESRGRRGAQEDAPAGQDQEDGQ
eukprot:11414113-Alexandrium_andersonii.AAC.1